MIHNATEICITWIMTKAIAWWATELQRTTWNKKTNDCSTVLYTYHRPFPNKFPFLHLQCIKTMVPEWGCELWPSLHLVHDSVYSCNMWLSTCTYAYMCIVVHVCARYSINLHVCHLPGKAGDKMLSRNDFNFNFFCNISIVCTHLTHSSCISWVS